MLEKIIDYCERIYELRDYNFRLVDEHEGGRNIVFICSKNMVDEYVLRISQLSDREEDDYLAELEFIHYLAQKGANVSNVILSKNEKMVECVEFSGKKTYICLFEYAKGMLISENGYKYCDGHPITEYFYNTGKVLGKIHRLSKEYKPKHKRCDYFEKYNNEYINKLIPDKYLELKLAIKRRFEMFSFLPKDIDKYGLVHFDFSDGNYHIDMNTGEITVFDFDNSMYCWYMYDLANLWIHGVGWFQSETDMVKRKKYMDEYFEMVLNGYRSETNVDDFILKKLPLFIDMVLIENIVDCFECAIRSNTEIDDDDINDNAYCLINDILYAGIIS